MAVDLDAKEYLLMEKYPRYFVKQVWGFVPQPVKKEYESRFKLGLLMRGKAWDEFCASVKPYWFGEYREGFHITWQQALVLYGIEKAIKGEIPMRISIVSGHGIGKSMLLSIIILWFLFVHPDSKVPCTAPTADQMYDVLWSEIKKWIERMPKELGQMYEWQTSHIRMKESPIEWFARAKTSSKENTEALAGVHADWVLMAADEASGIEEPIFETMEGALTSGNILVILISNGTRSIGYFYDTHHKNAERWQNYSFSSLDSPRVDQKYVDSIVAQYGEDSVQYTIRVLGSFPDEGILDDKGYVQLFSEKDLRFVPFDHDWKPVGRVTAGLDPSGEGQDKTAWAVKDRMRIAIVGEERTSSSMSMAIKSLTICDKYEVDPIDFAIDSFGSGHSVAQEIALATSKQKRPWRVSPHNVGELCEDLNERELYVNKRAMLYYKFMTWCRIGGEIMDSPKLKEELLSIRFKRTGNGRIQMMSKVEMKKLGFSSPNMADAMSLCFLRPDGEKRSLFGDIIDNAKKDFDPHSTME